MHNEKDLRKGKMKPISSIRELREKRRYLSKSWSCVQMMNRERIQLCQVKCRNTAMPKMPRTTHSKAKSDLEEQITKDSKTFDTFANTYWATSLSEKP